MFDVLLTLDLRQVLLAGHLVAIVMSLGVSLCLEALMLRSLLNGRTPPELVKVIQSTAPLVTGGFVLLWLSGLGFMFYAHVFSLEPSCHTKTYAKACIALVLTANFAANLRLVQPLLRKYAGRDLLANASREEVAVIASSAAVALVSWGFPLLCGLNPSLDDGYSVGNFLGQYALVLAPTVALFNVVAMKLREHRRSLSMLSYSGKAVA